MGMGDGGGQGVGGIGLRHAAGRQQPLDHELHLLLAGMAGAGLPYVETGIAVSVVVLGAIAIFRLAMPVAAAMGLVAFFAVFHGYAHGAEMPEMAAGLAYGAGFIVATAMLHGIGIGLGLMVGQFSGVSSAPRRAD